MASTQKMAEILGRFAKYHAENGTPSTEILLERGTRFEGRHDSSDYEKAKVWKEAGNPEPQHCYANSQHYSVHDSDARYFEGYCLIADNLIPQEHAWIVMPDGGVVDFTLELMEIEAEKQGIATDTSQTAYLGIEIPTMFATITMLKAGETQPLLELFLADQA